MGFKLLTKAEKTVKFLDRMVRIVFYSTFLFTIVIGYLAYIRNWTDVIYLLVEKWFDIMVKELIVMGFITIVKEGFASFIRRGELKHELELIRIKEETGSYADLEQGEY